MRNIPYWLNIGSILHQYGWATREVSEWIYARRIKKCHVNASRSQTNWNVFSIRVHCAKSISDCRRVLGSVDSWSSDTDTSVAQSLASRPSGSQTFGVGRTKMTTSSVVDDELAFLRQIRRGLAPQCWIPGRTISEPINDEVTLKGYSWLWIMELFDSRLYDFLLG